MPPVFLVLGLQTAGTVIATERMLYVDVGNIEIEFVKLTTVAKFASAVSFSYSCHSYQVNY
ncbi:MAG: hypothetical protein BVN30_06890 [Proteobacteria bacterium ST_bin16]|nr:MAG: hypothetical protein BVN30_06890 [Proteobacteria bacterium ST_bin16]